MNETTKDKGLRKAIQEQPQFRLPANFTFRTMQKVEAAALQRKQKAERKMLVAIIVTSVLMAAGSICGLVLFWGTEMRECLQSIGSGLSAAGQVSPVCMLTAVCILLLLTFDHWMRKEYFKRHS